MQKYYLQTDKSCAHKTGKVLTRQTYLRYKVFLLVCGSGLVSPPDPQDHTSSIFQRNMVRRVWGLD